jgi:hypothetical protein
MPSNDEVVFGIPQIQCPSCQCVFDLSKNRIDKFTKAQRKRMTTSENTYATADSSKPYTPHRDPFPNGEDFPSEAPEKNFIVISCGNIHCDQYNKFKVFKIPRVHTPSIKVDLSD